MTTPTLPPPACPSGYTLAQVDELVGERREEFDAWFYGQTGSICDGRIFNHETREYSVRCPEPHGFLVYAWDLERFLATRPR